jgi:hypothetical protein
MSKRYKLVVLSNAEADREGELNEWYDQHILHVLQVDGFVSAQRFRRVTTEPDQPSTHTYLAEFDIETDDISAVRNAMIAAAGTDAMPTSESLEGASVISLIFEPLSALVTGRP